MTDTSFSDLIISASIITNISQRKFDEAETILQAAVRTITASRSAQVEGDGKRQAAANLEDLQGKT